MEKKTLLYKLTGTETPKFITERENVIIDKCLDLINELEKPAEVQKPNFSFHLGNVSIETNNINELREYVDEIQEKKKPSEDYSNYISDFCYDVEATYQAHHELDADNWDMVHLDKTSK